MPFYVQGRRARLVASVGLPQEPTISRVCYSCSVLDFVSVFAVCVHVPIRTETTHRDVRGKFYSLRLHFYFIKLY